MIREIRRAGDLELEMAARLAKEKLHLFVRGELQATELDLGGWYIAIERQQKKAELDEQRRRRNRTAKVRVAPKRRANEFSDEQKSLMDRMHARFLQSRKHTSAPEHDELHPAPASER